MLRIVRIVKLAARRRRFESRRLNRQVARLSAQLAALQIQFTFCQAFTSSKLATLDEDLDAIIDRVNDLYGDNDGAAQLEDMASDISILLNDRDALESQVDDLRGEIDDLHERINCVENADVNELLNRLEVLEDAERGRVNDLIGAIENTIEEFRP